MSTSTKRPPPGSSSGRATSDSPTPPATAGSTTTGRTNPSNASRVAGGVAATGSPVAGLRRSGSSRGANGTPLSARSAAKRSSVISSGPSNLSSATSQGDAGVEAENALTEAAATIRDLKERLEKADLATEETRKQSTMLQSRLDDSARDQAKLEDQLHEEEERVEGLEIEKRDLIRQRRELEGIYEAERASTMKDKEESQGREEELHSSIQRLKENIASKEYRFGVEDDDRPSRPSSFRNTSSPHLESGHFAPPSSLQRSNSQNNSKILLQKDKVIESLRLELAEAQIKLVEMENMGGGKVQELEKVLLETRMANARLMEDNESFQLLLGEKTLNGDFARGDFMRSNAPAETPSSSPHRKSRDVGASLADELESAADDDGETGAPTTKTRRLEAEIASLKDEKKALTLYINKIIERVLQHQGFEDVLDQNSIGKTGKDKELPPPPPKEPSFGQSFLQRAKSVAIAANSGRARPRPTSMMPPPTTQTNTVNSDPNTAPSIPLGRSQSVRQSSLGHPHRRSASELGGPGGANAGAAAVVNNMYRPPLQRPPSGHISPISPRASAFGALTGTSGAQQSSSGSRGPSGGYQQSPLQRTPSGDLGDDNSQLPGSAALSISSSDGGPSSGGLADTPSPPRSVAASSIGAPGGSVMTGNKVRPLRLVRETEEEERARKQANRGSWMVSWFKGPGQQGEGIP